MKRHVQEFGVKPWAGQDLLDLQAEPFKVLDSFFQEYGPCVIKGCEVTPAGNLFNITPGLVALAGTDNENTATFKVVPFTGAEAVTLPLYLTLTHTVVTRPYADKKVRPIAYDYRATASTVQPTGTPFFEITATGGSRFVDAIKITGKLDKTGNGRDVTVTFAEAAERVDITSGEKLSGLFGKIAKWLASLKTVAFTGKAADLEQDTTHRLVSDTEKAAWADKYTKANTYTRTEIEQKIASVVDSAPGTLDTLKELAAALGNDPNFATSIMALIGGKADAVHAHTIANVAGLQNELGGKFDKTGGRLTGPVEIYKADNELIALDVVNPQYDNSYGKSSSMMFRSLIPARFGKIRAVMETSGVFNRFEFTKGDTDSVTNSEKVIATIADGSMKIGDKTVWHAGNLNPDNIKANGGNADTVGNIPYSRIHIASKDTLVNNVNLNTLIEEGTYNFQTGNGTGIGNIGIPEGAGYGTLIVNNGGQFITQTFVCYTSKTLTRIRTDNGTWSKWRELATTDQLDAKADKNHAHAGLMKIIIAGHVSAGGNRMDDSAGPIFEAFLTGDVYTVMHSRGNLNYHVTLTGGRGDGRGGHIFASLIEKGTTYFKVKTADDDQFNSGDFYFTMYEIV